MKKLLLLLVISCLAAAGCEGSISQHVPAVMDNNIGGMVNVTVRLAPGDGMVYASVWPRTGLMAQESMQTAVAYAYTLTGKEPECDVLVDFGAMPLTSYVEGPSAGTALAVMTYALLEGRTMRTDAVITGAVDQDGNVGPVGGLYEKAKGAASVGASYFITPVENVYEMLLLRELEDRYDMKVLQARNVSDVAAFMLDNKSIEQEPFTADKREIPDVGPYDYSSWAAFAPVAAAMIGLENSALEKVKDDGEESEAVKDFYGNELMRQQRLLDRGYLFSAANEAFLNYIDISTIAVIVKDDVDLPRKKGEAGICLSGIRRPQLTDRNFEWVVGAELRQAWAQDKLNSTSIDARMLKDESYVAYNQLMYADAWCHVAKDLLSAAPSGGTAINESAWKPIAEGRIEEARALDITDSELASRLNMAQAAYINGEYGTAIYDAVYVIENNKADSATEEEIESNVSGLVAEARESLWGRVYQSHAAFLQSQNNSAVAYRTALFARGIDNATAEMVVAMEPAATAPDDNGTAPEPAAEPGILSIALGAATFISILLFIVVVILLTRRSHGYNGQRPGKAYGAQQKKGRV